MKPRIKVKHHLSRIKIHSLKKLRKT